MIYVTLTLVALNVCFVVGLSGFAESMKRGVWHLLFKNKEFPGNFSLKPLDCPLCMTYWLCMATVLYLGEVSIFTLSFSALLALQAQNIVLLLFVIRDCIGWSLHGIQKIL